MDGLQEYKGILSTYPEIILIQRVSSHHDCYVFVLVA